MLPCPHLIFNYLLFEIYQQTGAMAGTHPHSHTRKHVYENGKSSYFSVHTLCTQKREKKNRMYNVQYIYQTLLSCLINFARDKIKFNVPNEFQINHRHHKPTNTVPCVFYDMQSRCRVGPASKSDTFRLCTPLFPSLDCR